MSTTQKLKSTIDNNNQYFYSSNRGHPGPLQGFNAVYNPYYSKLNPVSMLEIKSFTDVLKFDLIFVRDGYLGILYFFLNNPKPLENFSPTLFIPYCFKNLIPRHWQKQSYLYDFSFNSLQSSSFENIVLFSALNENLLSNKYSFDLEHFKKYENKDVVLSLHNWRESFPSTNEENFDEQYQNKCIQVSKMFKKDIKFCTDLRKLPFTRHKDFLFIDLNPTKELYFDNFLFHFFASSGKRILWESKLIKEECLEIPLSMNHSILVKKADSFDVNIFDEILVDLKLSQIKPALSNYHFLKFIHSKEKLILKNQSKG